MQSYSERALEQAEDTLERIAERLEDPDEMELKSAEVRRHTLQPGVPMRVQAPEGGGVIRRLRITPSDRSEQALRGTLLRIAFDDHETIVTPLGDFFGSGPGLNPLVSIATSVGRDGTLTSRWPMAFERGATITLEGRTGAQVETAIAPRTWDAQSLYFHARWRPPTTVRGLPANDYGVVRLEGEGIYVGNVFNVANSSKAWWGEGDEKIWIDDDAFPSWFGTGTEDYYGYAWCSTAPFNRPFHGQNPAWTVRIPTAAPHSIAGTCSIRSSSARASTSTWKCCTGSATPGSPST